MKLWNGHVSKFYESDDCKICLHPSTCTILYSLKDHSKEMAQKTDKPISIIIDDCPLRDIKKGGE